LLLGKFKVIFVTFSYLEVFVADLNALFKKVLDLASGQDVMGLALSDDKVSVLDSIPVFFDAHTG
jgi:hypothetical protein